MATILLTNDDGVMSLGLRVLRTALNGLGSVVVVAPEGPRSATSMSLTFHKPLRVTKVVIEEAEAYAISGNPADSISIAINKILSYKPDIVVSGINPGDNTSIQVIYASGTVAAAMQAAINGIPAIAISLEAPEETYFSHEGSKQNLERAAEISKIIVEWVLKKGLPEGVDLLNVNFPKNIDESTKVKITKSAKTKFEEFVLERKDPRGIPYYWQWGSIKTKLEPETDVYTVLVEGNISITPLSLDMSSPKIEVLDDLLKKLCSVISEEKFFLEEI